MIPLAILLGGVLLTVVVATIIVLKDKKPAH